MFRACILRSFAHKLFVELPSRKDEEHKNRVLSEATAADGAGSKKEGLIEQVTSLEGQDAGSTRGSLDEQEKATGSQQQSSEVDTSQALCAPYQI